MTISLKDIEYWKLVLYCIFYVIIGVSTLIFLVFYSVIGSFIKDRIIIIINKFIYKNINNIKKHPKKHINDVNKKSRIFQITLYGFEQIVGSGVILYLALSLIKLLLNDSEDFAYTIITLVIFVLSSIIVNFSTKITSLINDVVKSQVKVGELVKVGDFIGFVEARGQEFIRLIGLENKKIGNKNYREHYIVPITTFKYSAYSKFEPSDLKSNNIKI